MESSRFRAVEEAHSKKPVKIAPPERATSEYYGCNVFNRATMRKYLSSETRRVIYESIENGVTLDNSVAEHVAAGMKRWAMDMGATHYTHWFQPLTGGTAEKHDSFAEPHGQGGSLEKFSGKLLCQQEPDASSFPNGGLRNTFEARGYTAWDPSSPAFILDDCLCIPTVFISFTGEALDYKTPLLKSISAVTKATEDLLQYFGITDDPVHSYLGWEQEFFLVDSSLYSQRSDLMLTDRTLQGHSSSKTQQLENHYFGSIPPRVVEFMKHVEYESYKLGIPIKTRHNEVAPNQFEIAPVFEEANLAVDHNLLLMSLMHKIADIHGFKVLFHEKPYSCVNGSGKHCNWSLGTDSGIQLLSPGKTKVENLRFLMFMVNVIKAVHDNNALIKASIMTASNEHRLGANEAPPTIVSIFLGQQVSDAFDSFVEKEDMVSIKGKEEYSLGIPFIPELFVDNTDRNRTSPFAFTGNRFEFRAVGSSANCSSPVTIVNTVVADQMIKFKKGVDARIEKGDSVFDAIIMEIVDTYETCKSICFEGNGYSEEWREEAKERGLDCECSAPLTYDAWTTEKTISMFRETGVLTEVEIKARNEVRWETYGKEIEIEARTISDMTMNHIIPVAVGYQSKLLDNVFKIKELYSKEKYMQLAEYELDQIENISMHIREAMGLSRKLDEYCDKYHSMESMRSQAIAFHDVVVPCMAELRRHLDELEMIVDDRMWPMPKYRELLFIS